MEAIGHERKKVLWEVVDDHVVEEATDHDEIGLRGVGFNLVDEDEKGVGRKGPSEFPYLLMLIKPRPGYWKTQLKRINLKVDEDNGKAMGIGNGRYQKVRRFSSNKFWKNIGCLVSTPSFGLGGSRLYEKEEEMKISGKKRKMCSIRIRLICMRFVYPILFIVFSFIL